MMISLSFDVEQDCPPYLNTTKGIEEGLPLILGLLDRENVKATFFFTAKMAWSHPTLVRRLLEEGHELGCHGYDHERLDKIGKEQARRLITRSLVVLRRYGEVVSFRAPNLQLPEYLFPVLNREGILVDSSKAHYKRYRKSPGHLNGVVEVPVSVTSSILRLPWPLQEIIHKRLKEPRIYFAHPWEFVSIQERRVRYDCRFCTGLRALSLLERLISYYKTLNANFVLIREYLHICPLV